MNGNGVLTFKNGYTLQAKFLNDQVMEQYPGVLAREESKESYTVKIKQVADPKMTILETDKKVMFQLDIAGGKVVKLK